MANRTFQIVPFGNVLFANVPFECSCLWAQSHLEFVGGSFSHDKMGMDILSGPFKTTSDFVQFVNACFARFTNFKY